MQITIVEEQIVEAITDYITKQGLDLSNMLVEVELRATRGAEGYTATITLQPKNGRGSRSTSSPSPTPSGSKAKPLDIEKTVTEAKKGGRTKKADKPEDAPEAEAPETAPEATPEPAVEEAQEAPEQNQEAQPEAPAEEAAEAVSKPKLSIFASSKPKEESPAPSNTKSIFGDLKKPVNEPADA